MLIESNQNSKYKNWSKLKQKKYRNQLREFIVEGEHLVLEALAANIVNEVLICESSNCYLRNKKFNSQATFILKDNLFNKLAMTEAPQSVMAICRMRSQTIEKKNRLLLLDHVQDPGNLGTLIRSAVAFGFDGIVLGDGCVDLYNEKVIRSTQGAIFKLAFEHTALLTYILKLQAENVKVFGTSLKDGYPLRTIETFEKMAFIVGNEGYGVERELLMETDKNIFVEMNGDMESLNVSVAGSIIMYRFQL